MYMNLPQKIFNDDRRYEILNLNKEEARGGYLHFENKTLSSIKTLIAEGFLELNGSQNKGPTIAEMLRVAEEIGDGGITFEGYVISAERSDCRITLDGLNIHKNNIEASEDLKQTLEKWAESADEVTKFTDSVRLWWD